MPRHLILVGVLFAALAPPAAASSRDAARFAAFAKRAHATGTLSFRVSFRGDPDRCSDASTCGVKGTVTAPLRLDARRALRVHGDVVTLPVTGTAAADVRDTVAGRRCESRVRVRSAGLGFAGDGQGLLMRPGGSPATDPFDTACRGPALRELGTAARGAVRLRAVSAHVNVVRIVVHARRIVKASGYTATVTTTARLVLRR
jgi:hypothetical protein